jgi:hypothetical protein
MQVQADDEKKTDRRTDEQMPPSDPAFSYSVQYIASKTDWRPFKNEAITYVPKTDLNTRKNQISKQIFLLI